MATHDDYDGVYFTIQSLRLHHSLEEKNVDFIVIDNNPLSKHGEETKKFVEDRIGGKYIPHTENNTSFIKYKIFDYSESEYTICLDPHVMISKNGINHLISYFEKDISNQKNLVQGPLLHDSLKNVSTHFDPTWRDSMYGIWATNKEALEKNEPFDIPMQGMGAFACKTSNWIDISDKFKGFGGEEGYIHEKFRQNGGRTICLPQFKWIHRFGRPNGVPYPLKLEDRVWNYFIGWLEIYNDPNHQMIRDIKEHFNEKIGADKVENIFKEALKTHYGENIHQDVIYKFHKKNKIKSLIREIPIVEKL